MNMQVIERINNYGSNLSCGNLDLNLHLDLMKRQDIKRDSFYPSTVRYKIEETIQCGNDGVSHKSNKKLGQESNKAKKQRLKKEKQDSTTKARQEKKKKD